MTTPTVSQEQLEQARRALRIAEPLDRVSPLVLTTLSVVAHCWRGRVPASLWDSKHASTKQQDTSQPTSKRGVVDFKMLAAGDNE